MSEIHILSFNASLLPARHQQTNFFERRHSRINLAGDVAFVDDQEAIREGGHFFEFGGDEQDGAAGVAQGDELAVDELDGSDVHAARRLGDEQELWLQVELATDDQFLLVAAGERFCRTVDNRRTNVKIFQYLFGPFLNRRII